MCPRLREFRALTPSGCEDEFLSLASSFHCTVLNFAGPWRSTTGDATSAAAPSRPVARSAARASPPPPLAPAAASPARADDIGPKSGNSSSGFPEEAAAMAAEVAEIGGIVDGAGIIAAEDSFNFSGQDPWKKI